jgi:twitching motility two-component system response regulator PilH
MADCAVLVVEDDQDSREAMIEILRFEGYCVDGAANGQDALEVLRSGRFKPDVIVVDLYMPTMGGHEFRLALLDDSRFAHLPVIVCTGDSQRSVAPGAFATLLKPVDIDTLIAIVQRGCASRGFPRLATA